MRSPMNPDEIERAKQVLQRMAEQQGREQKAAMWRELAARGEVPPRGPTFETFKQMPVYIAGPEMLRGAIDAIEKDTLSRLPIGGTWWGISLVRYRDGFPLLFDETGSAYRFTWVWRIGMQDIRSTSYVTPRALESADAATELREAMWVALRALVEVVESRLNDASMQTAAKKGSPVDPPTTQRALELGEEER